MSEDTNPRLCEVLNCEDNAEHDYRYCGHHLNKHAVNQAPKMSDIYPKYYKKVGNLNELDVYAVHHLFDLKDPGGMIHHASKKLLLSGVRTGGKTAYQDIKEARDTLTRYLELNHE
jgi:hypothetical protein